MTCPTPHLLFPQPWLTPRYTRTHTLQRPSAGPALGQTAHVPPPGVFALALRDGTITIPMRQIRKLRQRGKKEASRLRPHSSLTAEQRPQREQSPGPGHSPSPLRPPSGCTESGEILRESDLRSAAAWVTGAGTGTSSWDGACELQGHHPRPGISEWLYLTDTWVTCLPVH